MWSGCVAFLGMGDKCTKMFDDFRDGVLVFGCRSGDPAIVRRRSYAGGALPSCP
jgi:hypothetical protein